jgi:hypothetical protein
MDHYPFSLMPLIADYLQSEEHIYKRGIRRPTIKNSSMHESKLRIFPAFAPFCGAPPEVEEGDEEGNTPKTLSEYVPTYHLIWLFQTIVLPTRFGNKHEPLYDGDAPPSYYFPQPPTDDEVEAFYTHPEVRAAMPVVSEEERELFRKARPLAQLRKEWSKEKHKVYQGGCWVLKSTGYHHQNVKEESTTTTTTIPAPSHIIDTHAREAAPFRLLHPTVSAKGGASGGVGMQLSSAVTHLVYRRNSIFGPPNTLPYKTYSDPSLVIGMERGMYGGYEGMMRGALYFEVWWGWGKAVKNKGLVSVVGGGLPTLLPERGYGDDCRASPHSSVMYLPPKHYNILDQNRQSGNNNGEGGSELDEGEDISTMDGEEDPTVNEEERAEKEYRTKALQKAKKALRQQVIDEMILARPLSHLRNHFPIGSLSAQVEISVQTEHQAGDVLSRKAPPLVHPHTAFIGTPWKLEEDGGLSSLIATAYHADGRPLPPNHKLRFVDPHATIHEGSVPPPSRITVSTRWSNHVGEEMATGGLARCVGVQTEWEDLPIPPPKHFAHYFPPAVARQAKRQA